MGEARTDAHKSWFDLSLLAVQGTREGGEMTPRIELGDTVNVFWERIEAEFDCVVKYIPMAEGDSWVVLRPDGTPIDFQHYSKIVKVKDHPQ
jgi:hypothetical protein